MFKKVLYTAVIFVFIFLMIGWMLPREVHVERSIRIDRPASTVFVLLNGFRTFNQWSPWARRDPDMTVQFSGPESGVGAAMAWEGDPRLVGRGRQEIIETQAWTRVRSRLEMDQQGVAVASFLIEPLGETSRLTWTFDTDLTEGQGLLGGILARYFGLFFDQWIGGDYEEGLANFKVFAESLPSTDFSSLDAELINAEPIPILYVPANSSQDPDDIASSLATAYSEITGFMADNEIEAAGQPLSITRGWNEEGYRFDAAIPVSVAPTQTTGRVRYGMSPSGRAVRVVHIGPYDQMASSYEKLAAYMAVHDLEEGMVSWEHYVSDPGVTPAEELITYIYFQVADD